VAAGVLSFLHVADFGEFVDELGLEIAGERFFHR